MEFEKFLTESYQDISVINAGVGGYHLSQEKSYAFNELIYREPIGFVFYDGWNNASSHVVCTSVWNDRSSSGHACNFTALSWGTGHLKK